MKHIRVSSFRQLHTGLAAFEDSPVAIFRGQSDLAWKLIPKAGRPPFDRIEDDYLFEDWKADTRAHIDPPLKPELERLAMAQHHGLATRLLDLDQKSNGCCVLRRVG